MHDRPGLYPPFVEDRLKWWQHCVMPLLKLVQACWLDPALSDIDTHEQQTKQTPDFTDTYYIPKFAT